ncbi:MAG: hypothetical protein ACP5M4_11060 [Acidobacteriaceae bacterium]
MKIQKIIFGLIVACLPIGVYAQQKSVGQWAIEQVRNPLTMKTFERYTLISNRPSGPLNVYPLITLECREGRIYTRTFSVPNEEFQSFQSIWSSTGIATTIDMKTDKWKKPVGIIAVQNSG